MNNVKLTTDLIQSNNTDWYYKRVQIKLPSGKTFHLWPSKDDWGCWSIGYSSDLAEIVEAINYILTLQEKC